MRMEERCSDSKMLEGKWNKWIKWKKERKRERKKSTMK